MSQVKLDEIDLRILRDLQENGKITNVELARRVGISAPPCLRRVRALEEAGFITGYHAEIEPAKLGYNVTVFAQVGLDSQSESELSAFEELVRSWPEVRDCHMLAGEADFILRIVAQDWETYQKFVTEKLTPAPNVANVKSALTLRASKHEPGVPVRIDKELSYSYFGWGVLIDFSKAWRRLNTEISSTIVDHDLTRYCRELSTLPKTLTIC